MFRRTFSTALWLSNPLKKASFNFNTGKYTNAIRKQGNQLLKKMPLIKIIPSLLRSQKKNEGDDSKKEGKKESPPPHQPKQQEPRQEKQSPEKQKQNRNSFKQFFNDFWRQPDPNDPKKHPSKLQVLWKKFQQIYGRFAIKMKVLYDKKISVWVIGLSILALYTFYRTYHSETQLSEQSFFQLVKINSFQEIEFVEEEYYRNREIRQKRIEGRINNQKYYCCVLSFQQILNYVVSRGDIKYKNIRRTHVEVVLNKLYVFMDTILLLFIIGTLTMTSRGSQLGGAMMTPQPKKFQVTKNVSIKFADVAGLHESKREVQEVVDFLKKPQKYQALGASVPKGVLLTGPPGTGKTLLAKACAGQAGVPFFSVSGSDFVQVFVGVGASRVRELFQQAKAMAPSIIFIDEIDAVGKKRQNKLGSNDERESTLNQLLVEMDGFGTNGKVIVMGATNRKEILDNALVRAGRFDREVEVGLPDLKGRYQILLVHLRPIQLSQKFTKEEYAKRIASLTPGFSGAELANLCNEAAILAARCSKSYVEMLDFELSSERVIGGVERKGFVSLKEKKTVAYHESGHAVVSWFLEGADPLLKVTIIPRSKGSLGFAQYFVNQNQLQTKQQLLDRICFILGGRCAELHFFKEVTTGAYDDLEKAYNLAYHLVAKFGMDNQVGYIAYPDMQYTKPYGEKVQSLIDREIKKIIAGCTQRTKGMVLKYQNEITKLSQQLLLKETLDVRNIQSILGPRPFPINKTFEAYLQTDIVQ